MLHAALCRALQNNEVNAFLERRQIDPAGCAVVPGVLGVQLHIARENSIEFIGRERNIGGEHGVPALSERGEQKLGQLHRRRVSIDVRLDGKGGHRGFAPVKTRPVLHDGTHTGGGDCLAVGGDDEHGLTFKRGHVHCKEAEHAAFLQRCSVVRRHTLFDAHGVLRLLVQRLIGNDDNRFSVWVNIKLTVN